MEGDFSWTGLKKSVNGPLLSHSGSSSAIIPVAGSNLSFQTEVQWLATLRARLGWLIQPNWLVYATGGAAWAHADVSANATCPVSTLDGCGLSLLSGAAFSSSTTLTGYVVGGGVEWQIPMTALGGHWRARVEYLYHGFNQSQSGSALFVNGTGAPVACNITPTCSALYGFGELQYPNRPGRSRLRVLIPTSDLPIRKPRAMSRGFHWREVHVRYWHLADMRWLRCKCLLLGVKRTC